MNSLPNESAYTLATVDTDEFTALLSPSSPPSYGSAPVHPPHHARRVVFNAACKMALIFTLSCILLGGTLWIALPTLEPYAYLFPFLAFFIPSFRDDRPLLRIPKSFANLQDLNYLLKKYRDIHPFRVFFSYVLTYLLSVPNFRRSTFPVLIPFSASKHSHYRDRCTFPSLVAQCGACPAPCL